MRQSLFFVAVLIGLAGLCGCSTYLDDYQFAPRPALAEIPATQPQEQPPVAALVSIVGVRRDDPKVHIPSSVEIRMRVDNNGPLPLIFNPASLQMSDGALMNFAPPIVEPPSEVTIPPTQSAWLVAYFPFAPGRNYDNSDLESLQLRWLVRIDGHPTRQVVYFRRIFPPRYSYYYDPYWDYPWYGGGYVVVGARFGGHFHGRR